MPTDLVVVLPGIMGSQLMRKGKPVWGPSAGSVIQAVTSFGQSLQELQLRDGIGDDHPQDGVEPAGLMPELQVLPGIWTPVKGYDKLMNRLRSLGYRDVSPDPEAPPGNLLALGYDWRLSNRYTAQWIAPRVEKALARWKAQGGQYANAQLVFVCHSMGGLVARWYIEKCGGAAHTRKLITLGTPYRGAAKALEQLVNGVHKGLGPLSVDLTLFARSMPSLHQLLPEYACIQAGNNLAKTTEITVPELSTSMASDAMRFHTELQNAETARPASLNSTYAILGVSQATPTTARISGGQVHLSDSYRGENLAGDATVPVVGASRADVEMDSNTLRHVPDKHGNLQRNKAALDELEAILTARRIHVRALGQVDAEADLPELILAGQPLPIRITLENDHRAAVLVTVTDEGGNVKTRRVEPPVTTSIDDLPPGAYTVDVTGLSPGSRIAPVSSTVLVWPSR